MKRQRNGRTASSDLKCDSVHRLEARLKQRVCTLVVPCLTDAFLQSREQGLRNHCQPTGAERREAFAAAVTLLYRLLLVSYAEARELLPVHFQAYRRVSLMSLQSEIAAAAGAGAYS